MGVSLNNWGGGEVATPPPPDRPLGVLWSVIDLRLFKREALVKTGLSQGDESKYHILEIGMTGTLIGIMVQA